MSNNQSGVSIASPVHLRRYVGLLTVLWTAAIALVLTWEVMDERQQTVEAARSEALGAWKKETAVYLWAASVGGVYVPAEKSASPDGNSERMEPRGAKTLSEHPLRMISPPAIATQIREFDTESPELKGHLTSLRLVGGQDAPDEWEKKALGAFADGQAEACEEQFINGKRYLRFMRPLYMQESCLPCHTHQGYKLGDLRGGLSVAVPMSLPWNEHLANVVNRLLGYGGMWLLGLLGLTLMSRHLQQQMTRRDQAEQALQELNASLEQRVQERTAELAQANSELENEIAERRQAEQWLLESEQRFRGYFEQGMVGMAIMAADRSWVEVNARLCKILGYSESELFLKSLADLTHPEHRTAAESEFQKILQGIVRGFVIDTQLIRKDGRTFPAGLSAQCMRKTDGSIDCILLAIQDMTHRRQESKQLDENN